MATAHTSKFVKALLDKGIIPAKTVSFAINAAVDSPIEINIRTLFTDMSEIEGLEGAIKIYRCPVCGGDLIDVTGSQDKMRMFACPACVMQMYNPAEASNGGRIQAVC